MTDDSQPLKGKLEKTEIVIPTSLLSDLKEHIPKGTFWYEDVASAIQWLKEKEVWHQLEEVSGHEQEELCMKADSGEWMIIKKKDFEEAFADVIEE